MTATLAPPVEHRTRRRPRLTPAEVALALYVGSLPIEKLASLPGVGGSLSRPLGLLAIALSLVGWVFHPKVRRPNQGHAALVLFVTWAALSAFWSTNPAASIARTSTYVPLVIIALLLHDRLARPGRLNLFLGSFVVGAAIGLAEVLATAPAQLASGGLERVGSANQDVNEFGITMAIAVAAALILVRNVASARVRLLAGVFASVAPLAIVLTGSKGALLSLLPSLVMVIARSARRGAAHLGRTLFTVVAAGALALAITPGENLERLMWIVSPEQEDASVETRSELASTGAEIVVEQPVTGVGSAAFSSELEEQGQAAKVAHITSLSIAAELGLVGLALSGYAVWYGVRVARRRRSQLTGGWIAFGCAWLIGANTLTWEHAKVTWFVLALLVSAPHLTDQLRPARRGA